MTAVEREPGQAPSELEGGGTDQTWGQGEGQHEQTIPEPEEPDAATDEEEPTSSYADGTARPLDDPDLPLTREEEGMDR
jgi:hypothetical protein